MREPPTIAIRDGPEKVIVSPIRFTSWFRQFLDRGIFVSQKEILLDETAPPMPIYDLAIRSAFWNLSRIFISYLSHECGQFGGEDNGLIPYLCELATSRLKIDADVACDLASSRIQQLDLAQEIAPVLLEMDACLEVLDHADREKIYQEQFAVEKDLNHRKDLVVQVRQKREANCKAKAKPKTKAKAKSIVHKWPSVVEFTLATTLKPPGNSI